MFDPPPGYVDLEADCRRAPSSQLYHQLDVPGVGIVRACHPMPNAIHALASAASADIAPSARVDYLVLFARNHLAADEMERLLTEMVDPDSDMPVDAIERTARAIATWDTARPTSPLSPSRG